VFALCPKGSCLSPIIDNGLCFSKPSHKHFGDLLQCFVVAYCFKIALSFWIDGFLLSRSRDNPSYLWYLIDDLVETFNCTYSTVVCDQAPFKRKGSCDIVTLGSKASCQIVPSPGRMSVSALTHEVFGEHTRQNSSFFS
jgi:hypothetical protein